MAKPIEGGIPLSVTVSTSDGLSVPGVLTVRHWNSKERSLRALKSLGIFWGGAVIAVLIPLLHFVLVPSLLVAGIVISWRTFHQQAIVLGGSTTCPKCKAPFNIVRSELRWPLKDVCAKCYQNVTIAP